MKKDLRLRIRINKANNQFNLTPKKTEIPKELKEKFNVSKYLKVDWEDIDFE